MCVLGLDLGGISLIASTEFKIKCSRFRLFCMENKLQVSHGKHLNQLMRS